MYEHNIIKQLFYLLTFALVVLTKQNHRKKYHFELLYICSGNICLGLTQAQKWGFLLHVRVSMSECSAAETTTQSIPTKLETNIIYQLSHCFRYTRLYTAIKSRLDIDVFCFDLNTYIHNIKILYYDSE